MVDTHYDVLWRFLRRLGVTSADVEDAAQRVFMVFAERAASIERGTERSFLMGCAVRIAADTRRKRARTREISGEVELERRPHPQLDAETLIGLRQRRRCLDEALDTLAEEHRVALVLVDFEGYTMAESSDILQIPPGTVASRLRRARELFDAAVAGLKARIDRGEL